MEKKPSADPCRRSSEKMDYFVGLVNFFSLETKAAISEGHQPSYKDLYFYNKTNEAKILGFCKDWQKVWSYQLLYSP